jgi:hypothetical protein
MQPLPASCMLPLEGPLRSPRTWDWATDRRIDVAACAMMMGSSNNHPLAAESTPLSPAEASRLLLTLAGETSGSVLVLVAPWWLPPHSPTFVHRVTNGGS